MDKKIILGIDTSTDNCSVGLVKNDILLAEKSEVAKTIHSEKLILFIDDILKEAKLKFDQIDAIAVNIGPGSYTGLRIGLSTAKGLAFSGNLPILPIPSLTVLSRSLDENSQEPKLLFINSHSNKVFYTYQKFDEKVDINCDIQFEDIEIIASKYPEISTFYGNYNFNLEKVNVKELMPFGKNVALIAYENYNDLINNFNEYLEPNYLTNFKAKKWDRSGK